MTEIKLKYKTEVKQRKRLTAVLAFLFVFYFKCAKAEIKHCFISVLFQLCGFFNIVLKHINEAKFSHQFRV